MEELTRTLLWSGAVVTLMFLSYKAGIFLNNRKWAFALLKVEDSMHAVAGIIAHGSGFAFTGKDWGKDKKGLRNCLIGDYKNKLSLFLNLAFRKVIIEVDGSGKQEYEDMFRNICFVSDKVVKEATDREDKKND